MSETSNKDMQTFTGGSTISFGKETSKRSKHTLHGILLRQAAFLIAWGLAMSLLKLKCTRQFLLDPH